MSDPAITTPPVVTTPVTAPAETGGTVTPAVVAAKPAVVVPKNKKSEIRIPMGAFKERVRRDSTALAKEVLGMTLEEAQAKLASVGTGAVTPGTTPNAAGNALESAKIEAELRKTRRELEAATKKVTDIESKAKKDAKRLRDQLTEATIREHARAAGVTDLNYALYLVMQAAQAGKLTSLDDAPKFFTELKTSKPMIFGSVEPAVVSVPAGTAPPESKNPGEAKPTPTQTTPGGAPVDATKMSAQDFNKHTQGQYGYRPGM